MEQAIGFSHLYPTVPIMNFLAMVSLLLLIPGFWKTRIIALVALVGWIFLANLLNFIGMIYWRGHTNDAPVLASILSVLWRIWACGWRMSSACFAHFIWQRLQPLCVRELYDTRRRNNLIHFFFTLILPLLWGPLYLVSIPFRYVIIEDFGPTLYASIRSDWPGYMVYSLPPILAYAAVVIFNVLALVNYWRMKREDIDSNIPKSHSSVRTSKLLLMGFINMLLAIYGICIVIFSMAVSEWDPPTSVAENVASLQIVLVKARFDLDTHDENVGSTARTAIFMPLNAFYLFAWFGLGAEMRKDYVEALLKLGRPINATLRAHWPHVTTLTFCWSATKFRQRLVNALSLVLPNAPQITRHTSSVLPDDSPELPAGPPPCAVGNRIDVERQGRVPSREPAPRLSIHKPLLAALNPANTIPSVSDVPLRRLSHHKPPFVPFTPPNAPAIANLSASGSTPPRKGAANDIRQRGGFASHPHARRLSYHKPAFVPLASANANGAVPDESGPTIPLVEIPRDIIGERNTILQAEDVVEDSVAPPLVSSVSTPTSAPPYSTPSTATPAPPYRDVNPFLVP